MAVIGTALELWEVADRAHPKRLAYTHRGEVLVMGADPAFSPHGRLLATTDNGMVILWDVADPARATRITTLTGQAWRRYRPVVLPRRAPAGMPCRSLSRACQHQRLLCADALSETFCVTRP